MTKIVFDEKKSGLWTVLVDGKTSSKWKEESAALGAASMLKVSNPDTTITYAYESLKEAVIHEN